MDEIDLTQSRLEQELARRLAEVQRRAAQPLEQGSGRCWHCGAEVVFCAALHDAVPRWCDADCRDGWERVRTAQKRAGKAPGRSQESFL